MEQFDFRDGTSSKSGRSLDKEKTFIKLHIYCEDVKLIIFVAHVLEN